MSIPLHFIPGPWIRLQEGTEEVPICVQTHFPSFPIKLPIYGSTGTLCLSYLVEEVGPSQKNYHGRYENLKVVCLKWYPEFRRNFLSHKLQYMILIPRSASRLWQSIFFLKSPWGEIFTQLPLSTASILENPCGLQAWNCPDSHPLQYISQTLSVSILAEAGVERATERSHTYPVFSKISLPYLLL